MKQWWDKLQNDEAYFRNFVARVSRFGLAVGGILITNWLGAPAWLQMLAGSTGFLVSAGDKNPAPEATEPETSAAPSES